MEESSHKLKSNGLIFSILTGLIVILMVFATSGKPSGKAADTFKEYRGYSPELAEEAFLQENSNENLLFLLKVLCAVPDAAGDDTLSPLIKQYGNELFSRAKQEKIDLLASGDEQSMLALLRILRECGAS